MANGHENIDNEILLNGLIEQISAIHKNRIDPSSVQEVRHGMTPFGTGTNVLYDALTEGKDKRQILRFFTGEDSPYNRKVEYQNLLMNLGTNPDFPDTLTAKQRPFAEEELDYSGKPFRYLYNMLFGNK